MTAWARSPDRDVWVAEGPARTRLTVTRLALERWQPNIAGRRGGPVCKTRLAAQHWCEREAAS